MTELEETREKTEFKENAMKKEKGKSEKEEKSEKHEKSETYEKEDVKAVVAGTRVSWTWVMLGVAVAFMLGLLTGLKL